MKNKKILSILLISVFGLASCNKNSSSSSLSSSSNNPTQYTVTWNVDGNIHVEKYLEGETPTYKFGTSKEVDATYTYTFTGWDKEIKAVTEDITYTAQYSSEYIEYTYTWVVGEEEITETYHYGDTPTYKGETPTKEGDEQYSYAFSGWGKELDSVDGDETLVAQFDRIVNSYDVTFNVNGVLTTETYYYGELPTFNGDTSREADDDYIYIFTGWDKEITQVTGPTTYTALYETKPNGFVVNFYNDEGTIIKTDNFKLGEIPTYDGTMPNVKNKNNESIIATGWINKETGETIDNELPAITGNVDYYAYSKDVNLVEVTHYKQDGTIISSETKRYDYDELFTINAIDVSGMVPSYEYVKGSNENYSKISIYYSELSVWDGKSSSSSLVGDGTIENPFLIQSANDLAYLDKNVDSGNTFAGKYFKLIKNIDLNNVNNFIIGDTNLYFEGHFDGNNYSIRGLNNNRTTSRAGLFANIRSGSISNLAVYGNVKGEQYTGGIVGLLENANAYNLTSYINVNGGTTNGVGGVLGGANQTVNIEKCSYYGTLNSSTQYTGGITSISWTSTSNIKNCANYGIINGGTRTGGIVGQMSGSLTDCINYGEINTSDAHTGGIIGTINSANVNPTNCINYGDITSDAQYPGGIVGAAYYNNTFTNCINYGDVTSITHYVGGVLGATATNGVILLLNCTNAGTVTASNYAGGMISKSFGKTTITNCTNTGVIVAKGAYKGEIYGDGTNITVIND